MKKIIFFMMGLMNVMVVANVHALERVTDRHYQRIESFKALLNDVDHTSLDQTVDQLNNTEFPIMNMYIQEAIAKAYDDIVREQDVEGVAKKRWLYSMIKLNMAYMQFGGNETTDKKPTALNKLIRQRLTQYLPKEIIEHRGFKTVID